MNHILKNWGFARIVRLILGILMAIYSMISQNYIFLVFGGWLLFQAIMNISCCGSGECYTDTKYKENIYGDQIKKYKPN
ncbi:hypothetical protein [uncultured Dysgonomonas sp.]|uniref:hypothetical protein n=1 Tax=Dysgonomonas mossii TaxID=163665 RepID=UPI002803DF36|nr:hypothetical protein [uncultured Dysgonomonas sp.]